MATILELQDKDVTIQEVTPTSAISGIVAESTLTRQQASDIVNGFLRDGWNNIQLIYKNGALIAIDGCF